MIGVVLWSDPMKGKAVFWCEDQGDLAYFEGSVSDPAANMNFDVGDMVQFSVMIVKRMRQAYDARLVMEEACAELPEKLRFTAAVQRSQTGKIIDFKARDSRPEKQIARSLKA